MSGRQTTWTETQFDSGDAATEMRRVLSDGFTGQLVLHVKRGRIMSLVERVCSIRQDTNQNSVDREQVINAFSES